ncbi:hypothetical protein FOMPIDRAFT_1115738, partial [Fomitopsis schrenkii]
CYDYCLTLSREVHYVWNKRLSFISTLFYLFRYSVLLSVGPVMLITRPPLSWQAPHHVIFSAMRIYVICDRKKSIFVSMLVLGFITPAITAVRNSRYARG